MTTSKQINQTLVELVQGDITKQTTDAIVNAANSALAGGGGVDGAIHRAAGMDALQEACRKIGHCDTGDAVITDGFHLPATYIIHAVGPIYRAGDPQIPQLLASAYRRSLEVAAEHDVKTIAFPAISTGVYGYPMAEAAQVSLGVVKTFAEANPALSLVRFVLFDARALGVFQTALESL